jgi:hypothetical protein
MKYLHRVIFILWLNLFQKTYHSRSRCFKKERSIETVNSPFVKLNRRINKTRATNCLNRYRVLYHKVDLKATSSL